MTSVNQHQVQFLLNAKMNGGFTAAFTKAQQEFARLGNEIQALDKLQKDVSSYDRQQKAIQATEEKLARLVQSHDLLQKEISETTGSTTALEREKLRLEQQIDNTRAALERQNERLTQTGTRLKDAGLDTSNLTARSLELGEQLKELRIRQEEAAKGAQTFGEKAAGAFSAAGDVLAAAGIAEALQKITSAIGESVRAAMEYETVMAGVRRTVGGSEESIAALGSGFRELSASIPITTSELGKIAETAGQLGIAQSAVGEFTQVMAQLSTTTDLTADTAATMLAQFANITGLTDYQRLGSTVAELGDATATTASKVVEMSQGLAASASLAGMAETDILAISAAVGSLGIEAQAGSTAMSTLISTLHKAVETGDSLAEFASVANMSAAEFKTAWGQNAAGALDRFIQGLSDTERNGRSAVVILDELGITNVRQTKAILGLASAGDLLSGTLEQANRAWNENTALQEKAGVMYATTESQLKMLQNSFNNLKIAVGEQFTPELRGLMSVGQDVLGAAEIFVRENPQTVKAVTAFSTVALGAAGAITAVNAAVKVFKALDMAAAFTSFPGQIVLATGTFLALFAASMELAEVTDKNLEAWDALTDAHQQGLQEYQKSTAAIDSEAESLLGLLDSLRSLSGQSEKTAADQAQISALCEQLNSAIPGLSLAYDAQSDSLTGLAGSLDAYIESLYQAQRGEKDVARLVALRSSIEETRAALEEARSVVESLQADYNRLAREGSDVFAVNQELAAYQARMAELSALLGEEEAEYAALTERVNAYSQAQSEAETTGGALSAALSGTAAELKLLAAAYEEAYSAALDSISGQYALWDEAAEVAVASAGSINSALESQEAYWRDYNNNLQTLAERSTEIEGLSAMIASFADGSTGSVNAIAGMAQASGAELRTMVENWQNLQAQQQKTSDALAQLAADMPGRMEALTQAVAEGVENMAMPETSAESARETIQAFIDQAGAMTSWVQSAYASLGRTAADALGVNLSAASQGLTLSERRERGYASGTRSAAPGWAWVGEEGPELMFFGGGERVLNARQSAALSAGPAAGETGPSVQLVFQIQGNASPETVQDLRAFGDEITSRVLDALDSAAADKARRTLR